MLTPEDIQTIRELIAQSKGPDRTGSGLSRKSLKDVLSRNNNRNPRRLDTHYSIQDPSTLAVDEEVFLNAYLPIFPPTGASIFQTEFVTCEEGTLECIANALAGSVAPIPSLLLQAYVNGVSLFSATVALTPGASVLTALSVPYAAGDLIALSVTNTGPLSVAEVFLNTTLLRKERFVA